MNGRKNPFHFSLFTASPFTVTYENEFSNRTRKRRQRAETCGIPLSHNTCDTPILGIKWEGYQLSLPSGPFSSSRCIQWACTGTTLKYASSTWIIHISVALGKKSSKCCTKRDTTMNFLKERALMFTFLVRAEEWKTNAIRRNDTLHSYLSSNHWNTWKTVLMVFTYDTSLKTRTKWTFALRATQGLSSNPILFTKKTPARLPRQMPQYCIQNKSNGIPVRRFHLRRTFDYELLGIYDIQFAQFFKRHSLICHSSMVDMFWLSMYKM